MRRLSDEERGLLGAAAVVGRRPGGGERLEERGLVRQAGVGYDFVHDVVRETMWKGLPTEERRLLHRAASHRLVPEDWPPEGSGPESAPGRDRAGSLARHAAEGGLAAEAFRWSLEAARQAEEIYADAEAAAYLAQARAAASTPEELRRAWTWTGNLEWRRTRFPEAALAFLEAVRRSVPGTPERLRMRLRLLEASLRGGLVDAPEVLDALGTLLDEAWVAGDPALLREARSVAAVLRGRANDEEGALEDADPGAGTAREKLPAHARAARSLVLLGMLEGGADERAVGEVLAELEGSGKGDHATWSDDREIVAVARARAREALGDRPGALEVLEGATAWVDDPFGLGLLLLEEARLRAPCDPRRAKVLEAEAHRVLAPLGLPAPVTGASAPTSRSPGRRRG